MDGGIVASQGAVSNGKPAALPVEPENIPDELKRIPRWVCWRYRLKRGVKMPKTRKDWTKVPYRCDGRLADATNPATWCSFDDALAAYQGGRHGFDGIGIVLWEKDTDSNGLVLAGVDFDDLGTKVPVPLAVERSKRLGSYIEASPSNQGLRVFLLARPLPSGINVNGTELYTGGRYLTVTGQNKGKVRPVRDGADAFAALAAELNGAGSSAAPAAPGALTLAGNSAAPGAPAKVFQGVAAAGEDLASGVDADLDLDMIRSAALALPVAQAVGGVEPLANEWWWKQVAMALAAAAADYPEATEELYGILDEISRQPGAGNYNPDENRKHFDRFVRDTQVKMAQGAQVIGLGTLFDAAEKAGWVRPVPRQLQVRQQPTDPFFGPLDFDAVNLEEYDFVVDGLVQRGLVSLIAAAGGASKTTLLVALAVAAAAGRPAFGPFKLKRDMDGTTGPMRVAVVAGEERRNDIALLVAAAAEVAQLTAAERRSVRDNLVVRALDQGAWRLGQPRPGAREEIAPEDADTELERLREGVLGHGTDLLVLDPFAALTAAPNENDNAVIADLLMRLARLATGAGCGVVVAHHIAKMTREAMAALRAEIVLARGAGAFVFNVRVMALITFLTEAEGQTFGMSPNEAALVRRLDRPKANNLPPMDPGFFKVVPVDVVTRTGRTQAVRAMEWIPAPVPRVDALPPVQRAQVLGMIRDGFVFDPVRHPGVRVGYTAHHRGGDRSVIPAVARITGLSEAEAKTLLGKLTADGLVAERSEVVPEYNTARNKGKNTAHQRLDLTPTGQAYTGLAAGNAAQPVQPAPAGTGAMAGGTADNMAGAMANAMAARFASMVKPSAATPGEDAGGNA